LDANIVGSEAGAVDVMIMPCLSMVGLRKWSVVLILPPLSLCLRLSTNRMLMAEISDFLS
jgi:hypothetical protein